MSQISIFNLQISGYRNLEHICYLLIVFDIQISFSQNMAWTLRLCIINGYHVVYVWPSLMKLPPNYDTLYIRFYG